MDLSSATRNYRFSVPDVNPQINCRGCLCETIRKARYSPS